MRLRRHLVAALGVALSIGSGETTLAADADERDRDLVDDAIEVDVAGVWEEEPILGKGLSLYKPNYFLPLSWSDESDDDGDSEAQFQISFKQRIGHTHVFFAYTQVSFWRIWDNEDSRPFRETNFNPEIFYRLRAKKNPLGAFDMDIGFEHESNGQSLPESRSWNRVYLRPIYRTRDWRVQLKLWARVGASDLPSTVDNPDGDDNPDITDFMGYHELELDWEFAGERRLSLMNRYNFREDNGALRLRYSEPTNVQGFYWFLQLFHGYGESLIDYDREISRVALGIALSR